MHLTLKENQKFLFKGTTLENDLHKEANFDVSLGEIKAILHPSADALAVLPLL